METTKRKRMSAAEAEELADELLSILKEQMGLVLRNGGIAAKQQYHQCFYLYLVCRPYSTSTREQSYYLGKDLDKAIAKLEKLDWLITPEEKEKAKRSCKAAQAA